MNQKITPQVTLTNWMDAPHNRWSFHNLPTEIGQAPIAGSGAAKPLNRSAESIDGFALRVPDGSTISIDQFLNATAADAMVVLHRGEVVFETYRNDMKPTSRHIAMSATKAVLGLLAEILAADGIVDVDAPVSNYVAEISASPYAEATLRHLLDMRAGVVFDDATERAYLQAVGWQPAREKVGLQAFFAGLRGKPASHGGAFHYNSANTDLLGWALERATGQTVQDVISSRLWQHIAADDATITLDWSGFARGSGGLCATLMDLARFGRLLAESNVHDGRVLPKSIGDDLISGGDRQAWIRGQWAEAFAPISRKMSYRSGWYTIDDDPEIFFAMGIFGQNIFIDRTNEIVIAKYSSWQQPVDGRALWLTHSAIGEIGRCLST